MVSATVAREMLEKFLAARQKRIEFMQGTDSSQALVQLQGDIEKIERGIAYWGEWVQETSVDTKSADEMGGVPFVAPIPCTGANVKEKTIRNCMGKIKIELAEAEEAFKEWEGGEDKAKHGFSLSEALLSEQLAEELTDVITSCTTALERLGYDFDDRQRMQAYVNEKNAKRGYHE